MPRIIKFRAWLPCGEWNEAGTEQAYEMVGADALAFEEYEPLADLLKNCENLMQFTGLTDKNGKDIYEGDIVKSIMFREYGDEPDMISEVIFECGVFALKQRHIDEGEVCPLSCEEEIELLGNIWENPEILKAGK